MDAWHISQGAHIKFHPYIATARTKSYPLSLGSAEVACDGARSPPSARVTYTRSDLVSLGG